MYIVHLRPFLPLCTSPSFFMRVQGFSLNEKQSNESVCSSQAKSFQSFGYFWGQQYKEKVRPLKPESQTFTCEEEES